MSEPRLAVERHGLWWTAHVHYGIGECLLHRRGRTRESAVRRVVEACGFDVPMRDAR